MTNSIIFMVMRSNARRFFGSSIGYVVVTVVDPDGAESLALFTRSEIEAAIARGGKNPEDHEPKGFLAKLSKLWFEVSGRG